MGTPTNGWKPGQSGNPAGRKPNAFNQAELRDLCRAQTDKALATLIRLLDCGVASVEIRAADSLLDRGWGKPNQAIQVTGAEGGPLTVVDAVRAMLAQKKEDAKPDDTPQSSDDKSEDNPEG